jgi:hypothetical protein
MQEVKEESRQELTERVRSRLDELQEEMKDLAQFSLFYQKKTPTAVFSYLTSIVDKHLDIVPEQSILFAILVQLRDDELLKCLLNISIYLGTIDSPEVFIAELKELYRRQENNPQKTTEWLSIINAKVSKKDRKKIDAMLQRQGQQESQVEPSNIEWDDQNVSTTMLILKKS